MKNENQATPKVILLEVPLMRIYIAQILNATENVLKFLIGFHPAPE
jgi:hypothetical protein